MPDALSQVENEKFFSKFLQIFLQIFVNFHLRRWASFYTMLELTGAVSDTKLSALSTIALAHCNFTVQFPKQTFLPQHIQCRDQIAITCTAGLHFLDGILQFNNLSLPWNIHIFPSLACGFVDIFLSARFSVDIFSTCRFFCFFFCFFFYFFILYFFSAILNLALRLRGFARCSSSPGTITLLWTALSGQSTLP